MGPNLPLLEIWANLEDSVQRNRMQGKWHCATHITSEVQLLKMIEFLHCLLGYLLREPWASMTAGYPETAMQRGSPNHIERPQAGAPVGTHSLCTRWQPASATRHAHETLSDDFSLQPSSTPVLESFQVRPRYRNRDNLHCQILWA